MRVSFPLKTAECENPFNRGWVYDSDGQMVAEVRDCKEQKELVQLFASAPTLFEGIENPSLIKELFALIKEATDKLHSMSLNPETEEKALLSVAMFELGKIRGTLSKIEGKS